MKTNTLATLNWQELELYTKALNPLIQGTYVDRVLVPERPRFPGGFLKGEWAIRLNDHKKDHHQNRTKEGCLILSVRPRHPYLSWAPNKGPRASTLATHSPFDLCLAKNLRGVKLLELVALPRERIAVLWFSNGNHEGGKAESRLGLVLVLFPAVPEALLVIAPGNSTNLTPGWEILARSRTLRNSTETQYFPPSGAQAPQNPPVRAELVSSPTTFLREITESMNLEAFSLRVQRLQKDLKQLQKQTDQKLQQSKKAHEEGQKEPSWQGFADLLKASLGNPPPVQEGKRWVFNYTTETSVSVPCDPNLSLTAQIEKYYQNAKRKQKRIQEAQLRMGRFEEIMARIDRTLEQLPQALDWETLEKTENQWNIFSGLPKVTQKSGRKGNAWLGKAFVSKDGLPLWVGRTKEENLELTFKNAKGNDLWMHVRGRPGAHLIIPLPSGKSPPLETLLDAAILVIHYSGGDHWGTTEVDYTFKKYVKRIKDSSEVNYTHNKTLLIQPDSARLSRLLEVANRAGSH